MNSDNRSISETQEVTTSRRSIRGAASRFPIKALLGPLTILAAFSSDLRSEAAITGSLYVENDTANDYDWGCNLTIYVQFNTTGWHEYARLSPGQSVTIRLNHPLGGQTWLYAEGTFAGRPVVWGPYLIDEDDDQPDHSWYITPGGDDRRSPGDD